MARVQEDLVKETSTTTGTGTYTLLGAVSGYRAFSVVGDGNKVACRVKMGTEYELGIYTYTASGTTLARTRIVRSSNSNNAVNWGAGTKEIYIVPMAFFASDIAPPKGHHYELPLSNDAGDTTNDILIGAGEVTDDTGEVVMKLTSSLVKRIDATWAVGSGSGGMNTGSVADNTWYELMLGMREDTGVVDAWFTTTANRNTLPTNYTHKRRIGWIRRGSATNLQFTQNGDRFTLTTKVNDVSATASATAASRTLTVPPSTIAIFRAACLGNVNINAENGVVFSELVEADLAPTNTNGFVCMGAGDFAIIGGSGVIQLRANSSSQIRDRSITATGSMAYDISTMGWIDDLGRKRAA